ncbi:WecB/TagA/CpsF family glycosyltransferase [Sandarakinorhabdus sp.]|uniref:WecB/TagA/CpsF family glycosyltransferase n=1 Tax=Sandarakinorhabdus sp. TaxID=1916663 RepID=UPI00286E1702|nr:WecB/TagA/CpsF family glycosyltransferase [Sandarakinorhabdus sp.]
MWPDLQLRLAFGDAGTLAFGYPEWRPPEWRQNWQSLVSQVVVTPDGQAKEALLDNFAYGIGVRTLGFVNAHAMNSAVTDPNFAADLLGLDHLVRDGVGVHALYRIIGKRSGLNLNGTDLVPELMARFAGQRVALFGTQLPIVDSVADILRRDHGCEVLTEDGFKSDGYYLDRVAKTRPALVVLGMGMPKQERVASLMKRGLHGNVAIVCGGAILDFLSGAKPRAPYWMRKSGLEWAFRLGLEPKRLFGRYVVGNPLFLLRTAILALRPRSPERRPRELPERPSTQEAFGIGGPVQARTSTFAFPDLSQRPLVDVAPAADEPAANELTANELKTAPAPQLPAKPAARAVSVFSANRPVVARHDLFGRQKDLDRLLAWVLDQSGNALIYGPRGYGKTSLVRVFGEIADSRDHVVLYASCSRDIGFEALMQTYLREIPANHLAAGSPSSPMSVQAIAGHLASVSDASIVLIIDEFDRIERDDTRQSIIELVKDVSDLTASVRFVIVGVATDASAILGYHPSIHRCITCVPLARLDAAAVREMFTRKALTDGLSIGETEIATVVRLAAGSAYHAQLIGQKLVSQARLTGRVAVDVADLDTVITDIVADAMLIDKGFQRLVRSMADPGMRRGLANLARMALTSQDDVIRLGQNTVTMMARHPDIGAAVAPDAAWMCSLLVDDGALCPVDPANPADGWRFTNAFMPQLLLMAAHRLIDDGVE